MKLKEMKLGLMDTKTGLWVKSISVNKRNVLLVNYTHEFTQFKPLQVINTLLKLLYTNNIKLTLVPYNTNANYNNIIMSFKTNERKFLSLHEFTKLISSCNEENIEKIGNVDFDIISAQ